MIKKLQYKASLKIWWRFYVPDSSRFGKNGTAVSGLSDVVQARCVRVQNVPKPDDGALALETIFVDYSLCSYLSSKRQSFG